MVCRCQCANLLRMCMYVGVCVFEVGARVREHRPNGSLLFDRFVVDIDKFL